MSRDDLAVPVLKVGTVFAIQFEDGLMFYQALPDGGVSKVGSTPPPPNLKPLAVDPTGNEVTRDTELEALQPDLPTRVYNVLRREGFKTVGDILDKNREIPGFYCQLRNIGGHGADRLAAYCYEWERAGL